jgi:hypothetical protein
MKNVFVLAFLSSVMSLTFAVELWNGFTSDMTKEQFLNRAQEVLLPKKIEQGEGYYIRDSIYPTYDDFGYPDGLTRIAFNSNLQDYEYISAYFFNEKLFFMKIDWSINGVLGVARERYGNPQKTLRSAYNNVYYWSLPGKDFYIDENSFIFVDSSARNPWVAEQRIILSEERAAEEARRKAKENEQRRRAESTVHF